MSKSIVLARNPGEIVPEQFLSIVRSAFPRGWLSIAYTDAGAVQVSVEKDAKDVSVQDLMDLSETVKDKKLLIAFGDPCHEDSIQPMFLLSKDNQDLLVAYLIGEWERFKELGSNLPASFYATNKYLHPKMNQLFKGVGENIDTLTEAMSHELFGMEMDAFAKDQEALVFFASNDQVKVLSPAKELAQFPWGWTTDALGYSEGMFPPKEETAKSKIAKILGKKASGPTSPVPQKTGEDLQVDVSVSPDGTQIASAEVPIIKNSAVQGAVKGTSSTPKGTKTVLTGDGERTSLQTTREMDNSISPEGVKSNTTIETNSSTSENELIETNKDPSLTGTKDTKDNKKPKYTPSLEELNKAERCGFYFDKDKEVFFPNTSIKGRKNLRRAYEQFLGAAPESGVRARIGVRPPQKTITKVVRGLTEAMQHVKDTAAHILPTPTTTSKVAEPPAPAPQEKVSETPVAPVEKPYVAALAQDKWDALRRMSASGMVTKMLGQSSKEFTDDPEKWHEKENRLPGFCSKMGIGLQDTFTWPTEYLESIGRTNPRALALYARDLRNALYEAYKTDNKKPETQTEQVQTKRVADETHGMRRVAGIKR